jgi:tetratricopeptide (TPR) repeat protein
MVSPLAARSMARRLAPSAAIGALAILLAAPAARAEIPAEVLSAQWVEVRTPHFQVLSDASDGTARSIAKKLEQFVAFLAVAQPGLRALPALPTDVYVFSNQAMLERYKPAASENLLGFSAPRPGRNVIVMSAAVEGGEKSEVLCHEYTHVFNAANFADMPIWLNEGLAQYYGTFRIHGRNADFGHKQPGPLWWLSEQMKGRDLLSFDVLFTFSTRSSVYQKNTEIRQTLYSQGWLLTHFLHADPARSTAFRAFLEALHSGQEPLRAWEANFPRAEWPALQLALKKYLDDNFLDFRSIPFSAPAEAASAESRAASTGAALAGLGALLMDLGPDRAAEAEEHLSAAVDRDSSSGLAWARLGHVIEARGDTARAERCYARAVALAPEDARVLLVVARGTLQRALMERSEEIARLARQRFAACLALDHDNPECQAGAGRADLVAGIANGGTVAMLATALQALPSRDDFAADLEFAR